MNKIIKLTDKQKIESFLRNDPFLHIYEIGDLDDFFWPYTTWYALINGDEIKSMFLYYYGTDLSVLLALESNKREEAKELLRGILTELPDKFYLHITPGLQSEFESNYKLNHFGLHQKLKLSKRELLIDERADFQTRFLKVSDEKIILDFYKESYPENWFDNRMLKTGKYIGCFSENQIISIAGIHVYSDKYKVAALGNITTHPDHRGKGIAAYITAVLCRDLFKTVDHVGLNVLDTNLSALKSYQNVGFGPHSAYEEFMVTRSK